MGDSHEHPPHTHGDAGREVPEWADTSVPDEALPPNSLSRRQLLRRAGLLGAGAVAMGAFGGVGTAAAAGSGAAPAGIGDALQFFTYLTGDHHIHTQYSPDGLYRVSDQVSRASRNGLDWMVITDHGSGPHARIGVEKVNPDIRAARAAVPRTLVFQGLEWNIPAAEHGTVFVAPGDNEVAVLKQFENTYDGVVANATASTPQNETLPVAGITFLAQQRSAGAIADALMLANHPARKGIDSPHEIRAWRDADPAIAIGMEGAPGHQAAAIPRPGHENNGRGFYDNSPSSQSFPGYPLESYVTYGGFDWMTSTVGGLWDSLLAEGRPWWITANSDSHMVYNDTLVRGAFAPGQTFDTQGFYPDPVDSGVPQAANGDFQPGFYSRTHVGVTRFGHLDVMAGMRAGRVWVDHGQLIDGIDVRLIPLDPFGPGFPFGATLGGTLTVRRGAALELIVTINTVNRPNFNGDRPTLARLDLIRGAVTGPAANRDTLTTPATSVVQSFDTSSRRGRFTLKATIRNTDGPF